MNTFIKVCLFLMANQAVDSFLICQKFKMKIFTKLGQELDPSNLDCILDEGNRQVILKVTDKYGRFVKLDEATQVILLDENNELVKHVFANVSDEVDLKDKKATDLRSTIALLKSLSETIDDSIARHLIKNRLLALATSIILSLSLTIILIGAIKRYRNRSKNQSADLAKNRPPGYSNL